MKVYLDDEKIHVDRCPHNGILCGLDSNDRNHCAKLGIAKNGQYISCSALFYT